MFTVVIPARYGSTRLPGKALGPIGFVLQLTMYVFVMRWSAAVQRC